MSTAVGVMADSHTASAGWTPASLGSSLMLWLDFSDTATITDAGSGAVSQVTDKSGNGRTFAQATGANRPTTGTRTLNGLNVLDFAGGHGLTHTFGANINQPVSIFAVAMSDSTVAGIFRIIGRGNSGVFSQGRNGTSGYYAAGTGRGIASAVTAGVAFQMTSYYQDTLSRCRFNGVQGHDGTSASPGTGAFAVSGTANPVGWTTSTTGQWDGIIAEIFVTNTNLNGTADQTSAEAYLKAKFNTP